jgi:hypothetical protein
VKEISARIFTVYMPPPNVSLASGKKKWKEREKERHYTMGIC